ncbi:MAG: peroxiredoxin-like family protein [Planctomycetota bacterium]
MSSAIQSVQDQLDQFAAEFAKNVTPEVRAIMDQTGQSVADYFAGLDVKSVGQIAPGFKLPDANGNTIELSSLLDNGPVVLTFYRGGWCPYCNIELRALQSALPQIQSQGASLVAVSPQTPDQSLSTAEKNELEFRVLSDFGNQVAADYGLVFSLPEPLRPIYADFGIDLPAYNGDETFELPVPATYVIDREGYVRYAFVNADYRRRAEPSDIVAALESLSAP